jgi:hypothetical protein
LDFTFLPLIVQMEQTSEIMAYLSALGLIEMDAIFVCVALLR